MSEQHNKSAITRDSKIIKELPSKKKVPGLISRFLYCWMIPVFYKGNVRDLEEDDLVPTKSTYESKRVGDMLERKWLEEEAAAKIAGRKPSFQKVLFKTFAWSFVPGGIIQFIFIATRTISPLLFSELLGFWSTDSTMTQQTASKYAIGMIILNCVGVCCNNHGILYCQQFGMKLRVATSSLMFRKIMRMDNGSLGETTAGKVVNILSNDLQRFDMAFSYLHYVWIIPLQLAAVSYLGYLRAGFAALIGLLAMIVIALPLQIIIGKLSGVLRARIAEKTDERINLMSEVISGIQVIKMYAWELPFEKVVHEKRKDEMKEVKKATYLRTALLGFLIFTERAALFVTVLTFILFGNTLTATIIYPLQQFIAAAQMNITLVLPVVLSSTAELFVSLRRVEEFMRLNDRPDLIVTSAVSQPTIFRNDSSSFRNSSEDALRPLYLDYAPTNGKFIKSLSQPGDTAVEIQNVSASWTNDPNYLALKKISLRIKKDKLCAVIGAVGSGKSSFLHLLLKELSPAAGTVSVFGKISYACQEAWLFPSTIRENIIFGLPFDAEKYKRVCKASALEKDFKQFPYGDQTLVGERGVSLSGGQRARINLARAIYREADIYLLDDPLSAVDANVGRQLFEGCINGYLRGRTRILVTHQVHFLKAADYIVVLNGGSVENMGTFDELLSSGKDFAMMLATLEDGKDKDTDSLGSVKMELKEKSQRIITISTTSSEGEDLQQFEAQKMKAEERQSGTLRWEVVTAYFSFGSYWTFTLFTLLMMLMPVISAGAADYWVSFWSNQMAAYEAKMGGSNFDTDMDTQLGPFTIAQYLIIYGSIVGACILLTNVRVLPFSQLCVSASKSLHKVMFSTMLKGIMRFFDTSSLGRILNRFSKDMGAIDEILPRTLLNVIQIYGTVAAILVLNAIALYWTVVPSFILIVVFYIFAKIYLKAAQGIKRLEATTKSPVFGMVSSSLNGIATIRSTGAEERLIDEFDQYQDLHSYAWNGYLCGGSTFGFYLDTVCLVYLTIVIFVFIYVDFGGIMAIGSVGLAVTQINQLTNLLQHGARLLAELAAQLTSVERVLEYTKIETEANLFEGQISLPPLWPKRGTIVFQNVDLRYAPDEAPVLKNLNITIEDGWKVGIVGRTGAGKSSLISAMFRFSYIDGSILIDGVEISLLSRQSLRAKLSIIPQEPVLFSATVRYNLDPFDIYSDDDIWRALEQVYLKSAIPSLDFKVTEGGANFSIGQRQLMCLARAVLRSNKILIMDEATANVDPQTDNFIQKTIRRQFASCTVLTIAHRLNTIMDSDRVLVMVSGRAAEFDHPYILLSNPDSHFSSMVRETGDKNSAQLFEVAKDAYFRSNLKENAK